MPPPEQEPPAEGSPIAVAGDLQDLQEPQEPQDPAAEASEAAGGRRGRWLVEGGIILVIAVVVAILLRLFVVQVFYVPSTSMLPTLHPGDRIAVSKLSYHFHTIDRGDVIVFKRPADEHCGGTPVPDLVKRVIGLPGDHISSTGNTVLIDGKPLAEPWLPKGTQLGPPIPPTVVPANSYYVLGDNRARSCDSRYWGPVPRSLIVGKVVAVIWPLSRIHWF